MIIINGRFLTQSITGVQRFAIEICRALKKNRIVFELVSPKGIIHSQLAAEFNAKTLGNLNGQLWEQITLVKYMLGKKEDILLSLCNSSSMYLKNQVVTIHDLAYVMNPNWFSKNFSNWYKFMIPRIAKNSRHILTVSNTSKIEIEKLLKIDNQKISVIYNGISEVFIPLNTKKDSKVNQCNINSDYILTVSSHHPRKNFKRLIDAFVNLKRKDIKLVIIGNFDKNFISDIKVSDYNKEEIIFLQNITDSELQMYYANAKLFVFPSLYEGFGIPIIEAAAQGTDLCVSNIPVFRELCDDQARYFDPCNIADITLMMEECLQTNRKVDAEFFIQKFSWKTSAKKLIEVIEKL